MKPNLSPQQQQHILALKQALDAFNRSRYIDVENVCHAILREDATQAEAYNLLAAAMLKTNRFDQAVAYQEQALRFAPGNLDHMKNLELMYRKAKQFDKALALIRKILTQQPNNETFHYCAGLSLNNLRRHQEALKHFNKAVALNSAYVKAHIMIAITELELGNISASRTAFDRAYSLAPEDHELRYNRSLLLLLQGDLKQGFAEYEARMFNSQLPGIPDVVLKKIPRWDGKPLNGKTLLVHMEQGHGDTIQFCRYIPQLQQFGGKVIVRCSKNLMELLASLKCQIEWADMNTALPACDFYVPLMSFPHMMGTTLETIPATTPYLQVPEEKIVQWKDVVDKNKFSVGISWAGSEKHPKDAARSIAFEQFSQLFTNTNIQFYSLQKGRGEEDIQALARNADNITALGHRIENFADSAAIIAQLDVVVTVDTAIAHLAGALDKPVWTLLPAVPDWRWMLARDDTAWYPSMRLFRQQKAGDWLSVLQRVAQELEQNLGENTQ